MKEKFQALEKTHTWNLVDIPCNKSVVINRWVYIVKTHVDGTLDRR